MPQLPAIPHSLGLYLHLPWCLKKCPYCDFNSHAAPAVLPEAAYADALLRDFDRSIAELPGQRFASVFFGGGTPSMFSPGTIARILEHVRASGRLDELSEVTLEANPGAADSGRFLGYRQAGVTRLSIGVQSFHDSLLRGLGRAHDGREAQRAVAAAADCFERISIDLMYGLPGQSPSQAREDVRLALHSGATHLSCYQLAIEPNTAFFGAPPELPPEQAIDEIERTVHGELRAAGFTRYEVSNWSMHGHVCRHNLNYWRFGDYLGLGAGAHSKLTVRAGVVRQARLRKPTSYVDRAHRAAQIGERRLLGPSELRFEFLLNSLRLVDGFEMAEFEDRTGCSRDEISGSLARCVERGLLQHSTTRVRTSARGLRFLNVILRELLSDVPDESLPGEARTAAGNST